jgi:hypothetical protein
MYGSPSPRPVAKNETAPSATLPLVATNVIRAIMNGPTHGDATRPITMPVKSEPISPRRPPRRPIAPEGSRMSNAPSALAITTASTATTPSTPRGSWSTRPMLLPASDAAMPTAVNVAASPRTYRTASGSVFAGRLSPCCAKTVIVTGMSGNTHGVRFKSSPKRMSDPR